VTTLDDSLFDTDEGQEDMSRRGDQPPGSPEPHAAERRDDDPVVIIDDSPVRIAPSRWVRETTFREKLRGYHPGDVDGFLDQVAFAFDELESRLRDAEERAAKAAGETAVAVADDETVRRTLTLAQRTAELAIAEAERQAAELVERARGESEGMVAAAEAEAAAIRERERSRLVAELTHLESARAVAAEDLDELETRRQREHERLTRVLRDLADVVEQRLT
jgi:DivIVA domain-containing protein